MRHELFFLLKVAFLERLISFVFSIKPNFLMVSLSEYFVKFHTVLDGKSFESSE